MKILVACEYSGRVRNAFRKIGHEAWSCDFMDSEDSSDYHYKGDVFDIINDGWDMMIAHPPCTYLSLAGNKWFGEKYKERFPTRHKDREDALDFVKNLQNNGEIKGKHMIHSELLRQKNHYGAIRKRLWGKPQKPKAANENIPVVIEPPKPKPSWRLAASFFDSHVNAYRAHKFNKYTSFIKHRCDDIGIQYEAFLNTSRRRKGSMDLSMKRHQIRWEAKKKFPELTLLQLSRLCGNLDHSSLLNSIQKMNKLVANGYKILGEENANI